jgi:prepilin-type N-terminal cleavage/methylation domain-containing protein
MVSLKNKKGFTIVELLIVIVVIGILATLVIVTFTGIQQKARNSQRQTDINAVDSHVEAFYAQYGAYPTYTQLNDTTWRQKYMKGLDAAALASPRSTNSAVNVVDTSASGDPYWYSPYTGDSGTTLCSGGATTTNTDDPVVDTTCTRFVLGANLEGSTTPYTKSSN